MLIFTRRVGQVVYIGEGASAVRLEVVSVGCNQVRLGFEGPAHMPIDREEIRALKERGIAVGDNVQIGVSVEDQATADERIPLLLQIPAARRIVSYEPALGPVDFERIETANGGAFLHVLSGMAVVPGKVLPYPKIDQVIVGGESGPQARPCNVDWIRSTVTQCKAAGVPCFVKQLGSRPYDPSWYGDGTPEGSRMRLDASKGNDMSEWPADLRVREVPNE